MAIDFRNYYEVLGVSKDATPDAIRKAFRKLARKHHPDVAENKETADEKFKEINEAYEVLSDPENRKKFDALGEHWNTPGGAPPPPPGRGYHSYGSPSGGGGQGVRFDGTGFSDFFEQYFNAQSGGGFHQADFGGGKARQNVTLRGRDIEADILVTLDEVLAGSERMLTLTNPNDHTSQTIRARIPKGVREGQLVRSAGLGSPGLNGGGAGDLFLRVRLERHPDFRVEGHDLYYELELAPWEAVLGTTVIVRTLHGEVNLTIPEGTEAGTTLRLREKGLPRGSAGKMGDLFATVTITTPSSVSDAERDLWQQLAKESKFNPRKS